jgi:putative DNA primase/helicase
MIETPAGEMEPEAIDAAFGDYLPWTDLGNARRLLRCYDGQIRYCADWGRWLLWEGSRWHEDAPENPGIRRYAHELADALFARKRTRDLGKKLQGGRNISSMLREAQALPGVNVRYDDLDTHEMLLAAPNGVIDLRTGRLLDPDPDLLITKGTDVPYDPTAKCPTFERFLVEIMKERRELVELLLRALGYSLTGSTKEQKFFLLYGERGRNGKSTLMDLMQDLLGYGLAYTIKKKLLTDSDADSARFSKAVIEGKRMVYADEAKKGSRFDTEFVKEFVGGKRMEAERKGKDAYQFKVHAKLWYAVNSLPSADFDSSFQDRLVPIPFEQSYYPPDSDLWREGDKDPDYDLPEKLLRELPGILALLVKGCLRWQEHGGLGLPEQVTALKRRYEADNDHVATWIAERCHKSEFARAKGTDLFQSYRDFAKGLGVRSIGRIGDFNARLEKEKGVRQIKPGNVSTFTGIELRLDQGALGDDE